MMPRTIPAPYARVCDLSVLPCFLSCQRIMTHKILITRLFAAALVCGASTLSAQALKRAPAPAPTDTQLELAKIQSVGEVMQRADQWREAKDLRRYTYAMERLLVLRPYSPKFMYGLAEAYAMQDQKTKAYDLMIKIQKQGLALSPDKDTDFDPIRKTPAFKYIVEGIEVNSTPWGEGKVAFTLQDAPEMVEAMAYDAKRKRFMFGSVRTGEILSSDATGKTQLFASPATTPELKSIFALAVDEARGFLWVGTGSVPPFVGFKQSDFGGAALLKFDLAKGKLLESYPIAAEGIARGIGAITIAASGEVYATDAVANLVYMIADGKLQTLFDVPIATSLRGIAVSPDRKFVYFTDYELGLRVADLEHQQVHDLTLENHNLGAIDGIYYYQGNLLALQNGTLPTRILRIKLDKGQGKIEAVQPIEANQEALLMPTFGAVVGDDFYLIANSQRDQYGPNGKPIEGETALSRNIYKVSARFGSDAGIKGGTQAPGPEVGLIPKK